MHEDSGFGRRDCVRLVIGSMLALCSLRYALAPAHAAARLQADLELGLRGSGAHTIGDAALLRRLGSAYLSLHPREHDMTRLLHSLGGANAATPSPNSLFDSIGRDWRVRDVALVDGWVLARTEARICALLHLIQGTTA